MNKLKRIAAVIAMSIIAVFAQAQNVVTDNNDVMKSNGKIYVVMCVVIVIVLGLFFYLIRLDRKITKLEKE
ncbi:MAG: CcmD family protein [Bacteroidota bacterium]|nr:CcmD family protein [Bacteroidota bacterium]